VRQWWWVNGDFATPALKEIGSSVFQDDIARRN
jgi:hypothetical protein